MHDVPDSDPRWGRWHEACRLFRSTGTWSHEPWHDLIPFPGGTRLPPFVWTVRGDEVWVWKEGAWTRADSQPARRFRLLGGTVCDERSAHDLTAVTNVHLVCDDCGYTTHVIPDGLTSEEWERVRFTYEPVSVGDA